MPHHLVIRFEPGHIHRIRNFGEELYHALKEDGWGSITLQDIDRATTEMCVAVHVKRRVRRISNLILRMLEKHNLASIASLAES